MILIVLELKYNSNITTEVCAKQIIYVVQKQQQVPHIAKTKISTHWILVVTIFSELRIKRHELAAARNQPG